MCSTPRPRVLKRIDGKVSPTFNATQQARFTQVANVASQRREATRQKERKTKTADVVKQQHIRQLVKQNSASIWWQKLNYWLFYKKWSFCGAFKAIFVAQRLRRYCSDSPALLPIFVQRIILP
jgi:hypothetical protein